jgi:hypothetical protein
MPHRAISLQYSYGYVVCECTCVSTLGRYSTIWRYGVHTYSFVMRTGGGRVPGQAVSCVIGGDRDIEVCIGVETERMYLLRVNSV